MDDELSVGKTRRVSVTVCIASIGRPSLLIALHSIAACRVPADTTIDVVIADDSVNGAVGLMLAGETDWPFAIRVVRSAAGNISVARNACLNAASGDYLAFIDDDEWADADWLINFIEHAEHSGADAIFGPIDAMFPEAAPNWICKAGPFVKRVGLHGSEVNTGSTCNALVRRESIERLGLRFREELGRSGGEDTDFFARLHASGAVLLASENAKLYEAVPMERLRIGHLYRRYMRGGQTYASIIIARSPFISRLQTYLMALIKIPAFLVFTAVCFPFRKDLALKCAFKVWLNIGKFRHALGLQMFRLY
ncbi:MAG TPA: glycosyltransferase [Methylobacter sp.]|jgi:succinoglycan biosynthesis protein ExoM